MEIGCNPPRCVRWTGSVISTISSSNTFASRAASSFSVATTSACAIAALASPINFPADAFSCGESEPNDRLASEIGALSPVCARRATLSESRSDAAVNAFWASLIHDAISAGFMEVILTCHL